MGQLNIHTPNNTPPNGAPPLPVLDIIAKAYKQWHAMLPHLPRISRYTLGIKIDALFIDLVEMILVASYASRLQKLPMLQQASIKLDLLKWFIQTAWELKVLDNRKYGVLAPLLVSAGKMIGGWIKQLTQQ